MVSFRRAAARRPGLPKPALVLILVGAAASIALWFVARALARAASPEIALGAIAAAALLVVVGAAWIVGRRPLPTLLWTLASIALAPLFWLWWVVVIGQAMLSDWGHRKPDVRSDDELTAEEVKRQPLVLHGGERAMLHLAVLTSCTLALLGLAFILAVVPAIRTQAEFQGREWARRDLADGRPVYQLVLPQDQPAVAPLVFDFEHGLPPHIEYESRMWDLAYRRALAYNDTVREWVAEHGLPANSALRTPPAAVRDWAGVLAALRAASPPAVGRHPAPGGAAGTAAVVVGEPHRDGVPVSLTLRESEPAVAWLVSDVYAVHWLSPRVVAIASRRPQEPRQRVEVFDLDEGRLVYGQALHDDHLAGLRGLRPQPSNGNE